jgi:hypothetical protein
VNSDSPPASPGPDDFWEATVRRVGVPDDTVAGVTTISCSCEVDPRTCAFNSLHDEQKRLFILTGTDGKTEYFRDNPAKYLMVEPDAQTGTMQPLFKFGRPSVVYLCREEREV